MNYFRPISSPSVLTAIFLGNFLSYLDRIALSIAAPEIVADLSLSPAQLGLVFSAFAFGYTPAAFFGGYSADKFGAARMMGVAIAAWSFFCAATAFAMNYLKLILIRILFGIAEGPFLPAANSLMGVVFKRERFATAWAITSTGQPVAGLVGGPLFGALIIALGWRVAFIVVGVLGLMLAAYWFSIAKKYGLNELKADSVPPPDAADTLRLSVLLPQLIRNPALMALTFAEFGFGYVLYFFLTWFPSYLVNEQEMSLASMSIASAVPWCAALLGLLSSGFFSDFLVRTGWSPLTARRAILVGSLILASFGVAFAGLVSSAVSAVALMAIGIFFLFMTVVCFVGVLQEIIPKQQQGSGAGLLVVGASVAGITAPAVTGGLIQWTGHFASTFVLAGTMSLVGAFLVFLFVRPDGHDLHLARSLRGRERT